MKCYICSSKIIEKKWNVNGFLIYRCTLCGLHFAVISNKINKFDYEKFDYHSPIDAELIIRKDVCRSINQLNKQLGEDTNVYLLDIGCGRGFLIEEAMKRNWICTGIDTSKKIIEFGLNKGLNVTQSNFENYNTSKKFDIVVINQVIEHVDEPRALIKKCHTLLKAGGLLYITTPNIDSLSAKIHKEYFDHIIPPEHLWLFNHSSISLLLKQNNFKILQSNTYGYPQDLAGLIKKIFKKNRYSNNGYTNKFKIGNKKMNRTLIKGIKIFLFDKIFCNMFNWIFSLDHFGINLEIIAQKK